MPSAMAAAAGESGEGPALPEEAEPWLEQPLTGETARLRSNRSMEGSRGLSRLTGQKAEPPWGVKFTLLGSGQEEMKAGLGWRGALVSSHTRTFSQPSGGSLWKQQLLLGRGEEESSRGSERSASLWEEHGDRRHISALSSTPRSKSTGRSSESGGEVER